MIKKTIAKSCVLSLFCLGLSLSAEAQYFGPVDYSNPWQWPDVGTRSAHQNAARLSEQKQGGLLDEGPFGSSGSNGGVGGVAGGDGNGSSISCSGGSSQGVTNCIQNVNIVQLGENAQLNNAEFENEVEDVEQENEGNSNEFNQSTTNNTTNTTNNNNSTP